jgi:hypothetical protein
MEVRILGVVDCDVVFMMVGGWVVGDVGIVGVRGVLFLLVLKGFA